MSQCWGLSNTFLKRNGPNRTKTGITRKGNQRFGWAQRPNRAKAEGYKRPVGKNDLISKYGYSGENPDFRAQKKYTSDIYLDGVSTSSPSLQRQWLPLKHQEREIHNCPFSYEQ